MSAVPAVTLALMLLVTACAPVDVGRPSDVIEPSDASDGPNAARASSLPFASPILAHELTDVRSGETFTLGELAAEKPVLLETMAIWCTTCLSQQREVVQAHELADFHSVGLDVDPNEEASELAEYADREGFHWRFAVADAELVRLLTDAYGFGVTNPPSTPTFIVTADGIRALEFGRVRSAEELVAELSAG